MKSTLFLIGFLFAAVVVHAQDEFTMKDGDTTYTMKKYYICFLKKGPNRLQDTAQARIIQNGHLAHINLLAKKEKVAIAGPFDDDSDIRGILIFMNVKNKEEVLQLEGEDPAVKAGRLVMEVHPWWAAKGSMLK